MLSSKQKQGQVLRQVEYFPVIPRVSSKVIMLALRMCTKKILEWLRLVGKAFLNSLCLQRGPQGVFGSTEDCLQMVRFWVRWMQHLRFQRGLQINESVCKKV